MSNVFHIPFLAIVKLYRGWQMMKLFFKWIKKASTDQAIIQTLANPVKHHSESW